MTAVCFSAIKTNKLNRMKQTKVDKQLEDLLFNVYEKGVKNEDCNLTEYVNKVKQALNIPPVIPRFYKLKYSLDFLEDYVFNMSDNLKNNRGVLEDLTKLIKWNRSYNKSNEV